MRPERRSQQPGLRQSPVNAKTQRNGEIRARFAAGGVTMDQLASEYGISRERVRQIVRGDVAKQR